MSIICPDDIRRDARELCTRVMQEIRFVWFDEMDGDEQSNGDGTANQERTFWFTRRNSTEGGSVMVLFNESRRGGDHISSTIRRTFLLNSLTSRLKSLDASRFAGESGLGSPSIDITESIIASTDIIGRQRSSADSCSLN